MKVVSAAYDIISANELIISVLKIKVKSIILTIAVSIRFHAYKKQLSKVHEAYKTGLTLFTK